VAVPEGEGISGAKRQFDVEGETGGDLVQDLCAKGSPKHLILTEGNGRRSMAAARVEGTTEGDCPF